MKTIKELELEFRVAAAKGDIATLQRLSSKINIDSVGADSKQSAVHRASANGRIDALMLLINLGANLELRDKEEKRAVDLAKDREVVKIFEQLALANLAIQAAKMFFPIKASDQDSDKLNEFRDCRDRGHKSGEIEWNKITENFNKEYKIQASKWDKDIPSEEEHELWNRAFESCQKYLRNIAFIKNIFMYANITGNLMGNCGEFSLVGLMVIELMTKNNYLVEKIIVSSLAFPEQKHAFLVMNRISGSDITDPETWGNALVIDPTNNYIYFTKYMKNYYDPLLMYAKKINIVVSATSQIPSLQPFPFIHDLYRDTAISLKKCITDELSKRKIDQEFVDNLLQRSVTRTADSESQLVSSMKSNLSIA